MKNSKYLIISLVFLILIVSCPSLASENEKEGKKTEGIAKQWLKTLVSVEQIPKKGEPKSIGTAFLVVTINRHTILVTAKHVVTDTQGDLKKNLAYRFNQKSGAAKLLSETHMKKHAQDWFFSRKNDVACRFIVFGNDFDILRIPYDFFLSSEHVQPGASVLIPGFPLGIRSAEHADPIVRKGIVARSGSNNTILDAFVYPGNSGGPVIYNPTLKFEGSIIKVPFINREKLIGLVSSSISYVETAVSQQTNRPRVTFEDNSGLCNIVPADAILELLNREDVKAL